jgi:Putative DNA-binding domain
MPPRLWRMSVASSPDLKSLQNLFRDALYDEAAATQFATHLENQGELDSTARIDTYRQSIQATFINCLKDTYPICEKIVGEQFFVAMAEAYIKQYPSHSENLNDYGDLFPDFIRNFKPAESLAYLGDVARLEWARQSAYYAEDADFGDFGALAQLTDQQQSKVRLIASQSASLIESDYPLLAIWNFAQEETQDETVNLQQGGVKLIVFRDDLHVRQEVLSEAQFLFLKLCRDGLVLEAIFEKLMGQGYHAQIEALLPELVRAKYLVDFEL